MKRRCWPTHEVMNRNERERAIAAGAEIAPCRVIMADGKLLIGQRIPPLSPPPAEQRDDKRIEPDRADFIW